MSRQLQPIDLVAPGSRGLNLQQQSNLLSPQFAVVADQAIIDNAGRLAAREGYTVQTGTPITGTPIVKTLFEYRQADGTTELIVGWDGGIGNDIDDPEGNDISGSVTDADGRWWFQNFNDKVVGFQDGQKPVVYNGTGNFATVVESSGTAPTSQNGIGLAAFGRVWGLDSDASTIKYSAQLDETDWGGSGAGSIDMQNIWTDGTDEVTAIQAFNGSLVVFGKRHVVFWNDGQGSQLGLDPDFIVVVDIITGTGCETQWSVQAVGQTDMVFLSSNGVQSLSRVIQERSNPVINLSKYVRDDLLFRVRGETVTDIRSVYSPREGFYLLAMPSQNLVYAFDMRRRYIDEDQDLVAVATQWGLAPRAMLYADDRETYFGFAGTVATYGGNDDDGSSFRFVYESPWLDLGEQLGNVLKMLKRIGAIVLADGTTTEMTFKWAVDFDPVFRSLTRSVNASVAGEWGLGEWGVAEWGGGLQLNIVRVPARARGQYFKLRLESDVLGEFALQQMEMFTKLGRLA